MLARGLSGVPLRDNGKYLLLDPRLVERRENAELRMGRVVKESRNPLFGEDKPWEVSIDNLYANVLYGEQDRVFKCWYNPFIYKQKHNMTPPAERRCNADYRRLPDHPTEMGVCYALSQDGVTWTKPDLGLTEFHGSKRNNIVLRSVHGPENYPPIDPKSPRPPIPPASQSHLHWTPHGSGIWKDVAEKDPARRYKMFFSNPRKFKTLPRRSFADCQPIYGDQANAMVHWGAEDNLGHPEGAPKIMDPGIFSAWSWSEGASTR